SLKGTEIVGLDFPREFLKKKGVNLIIKITAITSYKKYLQLIIKFNCCLVLGMLLLGIPLVNPLTACGNTGNTAATPDVSFLAMSMKHNITMQSVITFKQLAADMLIQPASNKNQVKSPVGKKYVVRPGDSLYRIATQNNITIRDLMIANNLKSFTIFPNQVLIIPGPRDRITNNNIASRSNITGTGITHTSAELDLLARLIAAEARGESNTAQVGVGAVVINRMLSPKFPDTIEGVIYQPGQFGPARTGRINRPAPESSIIAAKEALRGIDPTNEALFFTDVNSQCRFLRSLPVAFTDGRMIFYWAK
ncbi:MAG: cell wall hydrolase, partial [Desulfotomaculum sp.]|nr:cell wall hydrolase [Desulfotomaculum sp.]